MASPLDAPSPDALRTAYTDTAPAAPPLACGITLGRSAIETAGGRQDTSSTGRGPRGPESHKRGAAWNNSGRRLPLLA